MKTPPEHRVTIMEALHLLADVALERAHRDNELRDLAVVAEAWTLAGYHDGSLVDTLPYQPLRVSDRLDLVAQARKGRPRRLLRADARGLLSGFVVLAEAGILTDANAREATRQRWLARGGHGAEAA